jgi:hypothetical protein
MGAQGVAVTVTNLTPTFWSVCILIVITVGALLKVWPLLDRQKRESDASLRGDLLKRISDLELAQATSDHRHAEELRLERQRCDDEMSKLRTQVEGLQRMIIQFQVSSSKGFRLDVTPEGEKSISRVAEHLARKEGGE